MKEALSLGSGRMIAAILRSLIISDWRPWAELPCLYGRNVHVWRIDLHSVTLMSNELIALLSADEVQRLRRFRFPIDRDRFAAARGALRSILACYVKQCPGEIRFSYGKWGRPSLQANDGDALEFNLAHAEEIALCAVSRMPVGVDVERVRPDFPVERTVARFFAPREREYVLSVPSTERALHFFTFWTRKEALLKAIGVGLSANLESIDISEPTVCFDAARDGPRASNTTWNVLSFIPKAGHVGAIAHKTRSGEIAFFEWTSELLSRWHPPRRLPDVPQDKWCSTTRPSLLLKGCNPL